MVTGAKCGKCGAPFETHPKKGDRFESYLLRCSECGKKNRIPSTRIDDGAKCGDCGSDIRTDVLFMREPILITDNNFDDEVSHSPLPFLLVAWAPWCPTCRTFLPVMDDFAKDAKGKVRVGKVNVDDNPMLSSKFNILSVPQLFIFDRGQMKESIPGALQKHEIMMQMSHYI